MVEAWNGIGNGVAYNHTPPTFNKRTKENRRQRARRPLPQWDGQITPMFRVFRDDLCADFTIQISGKVYNIYMKKLLSFGVAVFAALQLLAIPSDARRAEAARKAEAIFARLSPNDAVSLTMMNSVAIKDPAIPQFHWWNEALHGYARSGLATVFPQAIGAAATFDPALEQKMADIISTEARAKVNLYRRRNQRGIYHCLSLWSPNVNMFRDPRWGRGQETFGEDPYLASVMGTAFVRGLQGDDPNFFKTVACAKHYAVHSGPEKKRHTFNVNLDRCDLYEYYLPAFKALVMDARVESVMGAYSAVNGVPCCANRTLLRDILRGEWGFKGVVVSDVGAVNDVSRNHKYAPDQVAGCLATMKGGLDLCSEGTYDCLRREVREGRLSKEQLRESVVRLLTTRILLGELDPNTKTPWDNLGADDVNTPAHKAVAREVAEKSLVLVKNNGVLPLDLSKYNQIGIWGRAREENVLYGNYEGRSGDMVTVFDGMLREIGPGIAIENNRDGDLVIACIGICPGDEGEDHDRKTLKMWVNNMNDLRDCRKKNPKRPIVSVVFGGSDVDIAEACELSDALLFAWYPGEQGGLAIARTLLGKSNPSGRLPITFYKDETKLPDFEDYALPGRTYRYTDENIHLPFGYGLSYTTYGYSDIRMKKGENGTVKVGARVTNTGTVAGEEVVQLYVRSPKASGDRRRLHLEGFRRVALKPGETKPVVFALTKEQLMQFGADGRQSLAKGEYTLCIGGGQPGFAKNVVETKVSF